MPTLPKTYTVKIEGGREGGFAYYHVLQNGVKVATITGSREYYLQGPNREFIGRFKYANAIASAKDFAKFLFSRMTLADYLKGIKDAELKGAGSVYKPYDSTPLGFLETLGYKSYNSRLIERRQAKRALGARIYKIKSVGSTVGVGLGY